MNPSGERITLGNRNSFSNFLSAKSGSVQAPYEPNPYNIPPQHQTPSRNLQVPQLSEPVQSMGLRNGADDEMYFSEEAYGGRYEPSQGFSSHDHQMNGNPQPKQSAYTYGNDQNQHTLSRQSYYNEQHPPKRTAFYESHWPLYSCDWAYNGPPGIDLLALTTISEESSNRIQIVHGFPTDQAGYQSLNFQKSAEYSVPYPCTRIAWAPPSLRTPPSNMQLITTGDCLRLWNYSAESGQLKQKCALVNKTKSSYMPPVTSFDWNKIDPGVVITSSIDTTCTVWDVVASTARTQLIAHDSEVFDVSFVANSVEIFASVGADGSVRVFDLRSLDHSTIIYEPQQAAPLVRIESNPQEQNTLATFASNANDIIILDIRVPGTPVATLTGHKAPVNTIAWAPSSSNLRPTAGSNHSRRHILASGGDDCQALIWDVTDPSRNPRPPLSQTKNSAARVSTPPVDVPIVSAYTDSFEINSLTWNRDASWLGVVSGRGVQGVRA